MGDNKCFDLREYIPNEEQFWNQFSVLKSPGDGHCFIHSVSASVAPMHPRERDIGKGKEWSIELYAMVYPICWWGIKDDFIKWYAWVYRS